MRYDQVVNQPATNEIPIQWGADVHPMPDGTEWVVVIIDLPFGQFRTMMPPDAARKLGKGMYDMLRQVAEQCKKKTGLVITPMSDVLKNKMNGN